MQTQTLSTKKIDTKKLVLMSMFAAISYIAVFLLRVPIFVTFLDYECKSVIIAVAGFLFGPAAVVLISVPVCLLEMVTISATGPIGALMNIIATIAFALPAALLYKKKRTLNSAVIGLLIGTIAMTALMLLWNYIITPLYMGVPREVVAGMLLPTIAPFNLLKASLNSSLTFLLYQPLINVLRKSKLIPPSAVAEKIDRSAIIKYNIWAALLAVIGITAVIYLHIILK